MAFWGWGCLGFLPGGVHPLICQMNPRAEPQFVSGFTIREGRVRARIWVSSLTWSVFPPQLPAPAQIGREEFSSSEARAPAKAAGDLNTLVKKRIRQEFPATGWNPLCGAMWDFTCCTIRDLFCLSPFFTKLPFLSLRPGSWYLTFHLFHQVSGWRPDQKRLKQGRR